MKRNMKVIAVASILLLAGSGAFAKAKSKKKSLDAVRIGNVFDIVS